MDELAQNELDGLVQQAEVLYARGEMDAAVQQLSQVLQAAPDHVRALNDLGTICYGRGALDSAAQCYNHALELSPHSLVYLTNFVTVLLDLGELDAAAGMLTSGLALHPGDVTLCQLQHELELRSVKVELPSTTAWAFRVVEADEKSVVASVA